MKTAKLIILSTFLLSLNLFASIDHPKCKGLVKNLGPLFAGKINRFCRPVFTTDLDQERREFIEFSRERLQILENLLSSVLGRDFYPLELYFEDKSSYAHSYIIRHVTDYKGYFLAVEARLKALFRDTCINATLLFQNMEIKTHRRRGVKKSYCEKWSQYLENSNDRFDQLYHRISHAEKKDHLINDLFGKKIIARKIYPFLSRKQRRELERMTI